MMHSEYVGPDIAERLLQALPKAPKCPPHVESYWRLLPDETFVLVGTERVYAPTREGTRGKPAPVAIDLGGDVPFILWK
jgi:hypothetical protein